MSEQKSGRGGKRAGAGRRPKRGSPMPKTGITASANQLVFYYLLSGPNMASVSAGIQLAVERLAKVDDKANDLLKQSEWMIARAKEILEADDIEATQKELYSYCFENLLDLQAQYEEK